MLAKAKCTYSSWSSQEKICMKRRAHYDASAPVYCASQPHLPTARAIPHSHSLLLLGLSLPVPLEFVVRGIEMLFPEHRPNHCSRVQKRHGASRSLAPSGSRIAFVISR
uniref:Uncharacterized protein n=1 Tax=uncultured marine microorganism HF4000_APKG8C21 TaxID=455553 RepID=B3TA39_9ZZZZ|nr:hypothetical protein ALOHA_HF4000APKG8C21ctg1g36 [uncultured marine microorganism HF4000_APKG8C21]